MSEFSFSAQKDTSLKRHVVTEIRTAIVKGHIRAGYKLKEAVLAEQMGISRGPIREALRDLEAMGLVMSQPYRETVVVDINKDEISELLIPIRQSVELYAIKVGWPTFSEGLFQQLDDLVNQMDQFADQGDLFNLVDQDVRFHAAVVNWSNIHFARQVFSMIENHMVMHFFRNTQTFSDLHKVTKDHKSLLQLLRQGNYDTIIDGWIRHIRQDAFLFSLNP